MWRTMRSLQTNRSDPERPSLLRTSACRVWVNSQGRAAHPGDVVRARRRHRNADLLRIAGSQPVVHLGLCRRVRAWLNLRLLARRVAFGAIEAIWAAVAAHELDAVTPPCRGHCRLYQHIREIKGRPLRGRPCQGALTARAASNSRPQAGRCPCRSGLLPSLSYPDAFVFRSGMRRVAHADKCCVGPPGSAPRRCRFCHLHHGMARTRLRSQASAAPGRLRAASP
jgi:hypothetical protein